MRPRHIVGYLLVGALVLVAIQFITGLIGDGYK
jgi:hypothetical protein